MTPYQQVLEFRKTFELFIANSPILPTEKEREFQSNMISDEATEMYEADSHNEYKDGIADVLYFAFGAAIESGITEEALTKAFKKVHVANMRKLWSLKEVEDMPNNVKAQYHVKPHYIDPTKYIVRYRYDGKIAKPPSWVEPAHEI